MISQREPWRPRFFGNPARHNLWLRIPTNSSTESDIRKPLERRIGFVCAEPSNVDENSPSPATSGRRRFTMVRNVRSGLRRQRRSVNGAARDASAPHPEVAP